MQKPRAGRDGIAKLGAVKALIARVVVYYVALAAVVFGVWAILPAGARVEVMAALSSLVAFRESVTAILAK